MADSFTQLTAPASLLGGARRSSSSRCGSEHAPVLHTQCGCLRGPARALEPFGAGPKTVLAPAQADVRAARCVCRVAWFAATSALLLCCALIAVSTQDGSSSRRYPVCMWPCRPMAVAAQRSPCCGCQRAWALRVCSAAALQAWCLLWGRIRVSLDDVPLPGGTVTTQNPGIVDPNAVAPSITQVISDIRLLLGRAGRAWL